MVLILISILCFGIAVWIAWEISAAAYGFADAKYGDRAASCALLLVWAIFFGICFGFSREDSFIPVEFTADMIEGRFTE